MEPSIKEFLQAKQTAYIKNKTKANFDEQEKQKVILEAQQKFSLTEWLKDSANRAKQLSYSTHPAKFSHPDAKISHFIAQKPANNDGLLRTGNATAQQDVIGNAACLDVHKFLSLKLSNQLSIIENLEQNTPLIQSLFNIPNIDYHFICNEYLKIKQTSPADQSHTLLKQVYFPIADDYHLLSLLTPSPLMFELTQRINAINFSENNKHTREQRKQATDNTEFQGNINEILNSVTIGFGGSQPQNISALNSQNGGTSLLLPSLPPVLSKRPIQPPKEDFYTSTLWVTLKLNNLFLQLKKTINQSTGRSIIQRKRNAILKDIFFHIHQFALKTRQNPPNWSDSPTYQKLPQWQKIYLDNKYIEIREDNEQNHDYKNKCIKASARWISQTYEDLCKVNLGDPELKEIQKHLQQEINILS